MLFVRKIEKDSDRLVNAEHHFRATGNRLKMKLYIYIYIYIQIQASQTGPYIPYCPLYSVEVPKVPYLHDLVPKVPYFQPLVCIF